jgi:hypothetical protein
MAMWYVTNQKSGVSARGLQRVLGLGSYETAWTWLHTLRRAMVRPDRDALNGTVEVDKTYVGGVEKGKHGRETETKSIIAIAAEENGKGIGRIRIRRIKDVTGASLLPFVQSAVVPGVVVHTDGCSGYAGLTAAGYKHKITIVSASPDPAHVVMARRASDVGEMETASYPTQPPAPTSRSVQRGLADIFPPILSR